MMVLDGNASVLKQGPNRLFVYLFVTRNVVELGVRFPCRANSSAVRIPLPCGRDVPVFHFGSPTVEGSHTMVDDAQPTIADGARFRVARSDVVFTATGA